MRRRAFVDTDLPTSGMRANTRQTNLLSRRSLRAAIRCVALLILVFATGLIAARIWQIATLAEETTKSSSLSVQPMAICPLGTNLIVNGDAEADPTVTGDGFIDENV